MIDDLMDSLVVDRPLPGAAIKAELAELRQGAEDLAPILWSFRNKEWVRIGTRDILGREPIRAGHPRAGRRRRGHRRPGRRATSGSRRAARFGIPIRPSDGRRDRWAILALGKLGGRELNYHSDLDLVFLHEEDGQTGGTGQADLQRAVRHRGGPAHAQGAGRRRLDRPALSRVDTRLRPHGASGPPGRHAGSLPCSTSSPRRQTWERLALTRARVIFATGGFGRHVTDAIRSILCRAGRSAEALRPEVARHAAEARGVARAKRPEAGIRRCRRPRVHRPVPDARPRLRAARTCCARTSGMRSMRLQRAGILSPDDHAELRDAYDFLRTVEGRLRLIHNRAAPTFPTIPPTSSAWRGG